MVGLDFKNMKTHSTAVSLPNKPGILQKPMQQGKLYLTNPTFLVFYLRQAPGGMLVYLWREAESTCIGII